MKEITKREALYLIKLLHKSRRHGGNHNNIEVDTASLHETEKYFLEQKLEKIGE